MKLTSISGYEYTHGFSRGDIDGGFRRAIRPYLLRLRHTGRPGLPSPMDAGTAPGVGLDLTVVLAGRCALLLHRLSGHNLSVLHPANSVRQSNVSEAVFGQASYRFTDDFKLTGGVRWTSDMKGMTANGPLDVISTPVKVGGNNVSWDFSADYIASEASISTPASPSASARRRSRVATSPSTLRSDHRCHRATTRRLGPRPSRPMRLAQNGVVQSTIRLNFDGYSYYIRDIRNFPRSVARRQFRDPAERPWRSRLWSWKPTPNGRQQTICCSPLAQLDTHRNPRPELDDGDLRPMHGQQSGCPRKCSS